MGKREGIIELAAICWVYAGKWTFCGHASDHKQDWRISVTSVSWLSMLTSVRAGVFKRHNILQSTLCRFNSPPNYQSSCHNAAVSRAQMKSRQRSQKSNHSPRYVTRQSTAVAVDISSSSRFGKIPDFEGPCIPAVLRLLL